MASMLHPTASSSSSSSSASALAFRSSLSCGRFWLNYSRCQIPSRSSIVSKLLYILHLKWETNPSFGCSEKLGDKKRKHRSELDLFAVIWGLLCHEA